MVPDRTAPAPSLSPTRGTSPEHRGRGVIVSDVDTWSSGMSSNSVPWRLRSFDGHADLADLAQRSRAGRCRSPSAKARHKKVWPDMLEALRQTGWHNYSLFLREDGMLIGYLETPDFRQSNCRHGHEGSQRPLASPDARVFRGSGGRPADQQMSSLEEVFHLD